MGALALSAQACVYGQVLDAQNASALASARVTASAYCEGLGCNSSNLVVTDSSGWYVYDAFGDYRGQSQRMMLRPLDGNSSIRLMVSRTGYQTRTVYHEPQYEELQHNGKTYAVSAVKQVYLCRVGAPDNDGDGLCNDAEARYGTNPNHRDTDGDALDDAVELFGTNDVDLARYGANPLRKDIFVEVDYYAAFKPEQSALNAVAQAFATAPVSNPDGSTGISLHILLDDQIAMSDEVDVLDPITFTNLKAKYFDSRRWPLFHYGLYGRRNVGGSAGFSRGRAVHDFYVTLDGRGNTPIQQSSLFMHELGHNLGLEHGGADTDNNKPHYFSVMNYNYTMGGIIRDGASGVLDYSRVRVAGVSELSFTESSAFAPVAPTTEADLARYSVVLCTTLVSGTASTNLDVNLDGLISSSPWPALLDCEWPGARSWGATQNDWEHLEFGVLGLVPLMSEPTSLTSTTSEGCFPPDAVPSLSKRASGR